MGEGVMNDRRGVQDPWDSTFRKAGSVVSPALNPLTGPNLKLALPFLEVQVDGRMYRGEPWKKTGRIVLPNSTLSSTSAAHLARAQNLAAAETTAIAAICTFDAPAGKICVVTRVRIRFGDNIALDKVKVSLLDGSSQSVTAQSGDSSRALSQEQQLHIDLDEAVEVDFRCRGDKTVKLLAETKDTECPHYIEGTFEGVLFPVSILNPGGAGDDTK